jgi:cation transport regulator
MPYKKLSDLPDNVTDNVPKHAQEIYQAAYNSAWEQYDHDEERAHRVAWAAVKNDYEKDEESGRWKKKD